MTYCTTPVPAATNSNESKPAPPEIVAFAAVSALSIVIVSAPPPVLIEVNAPHL